MALSFLYYYVMVHEEDLKNRPLSNEELYRMKYNQLSACIHKLCNHLLGENWYIVDAVDETTTCEIRYRNVNKKFNWRLKK